MEIEPYMKDDLYNPGCGEYSAYTDKKMRIKWVKKHHTITTDYHHKKFDDFIEYNYIPYGLKIDIDDNGGTIWFMTKNNEIREDETLESAHAQMKLIQNTLDFLEKNE